MACLFLATRKPSCTQKLPSNIGAVRNSCQYDRTPCVSMPTRATAAFFRMGDHPKTTQCYTFKWGRWVPPISGTMNQWVIFHRWQGMADASIFSPQGLQKVSSQGTTSSHSFCRSQFAQTRHQQAQQVFLTTIQLFFIPMDPSYFQRSSTPLDKIPKEHQPPTTSSSWYP